MSSEPIFLTLQTEFMWGICFDVYAWRPEFFVDKNGSRHWETWENIKEKQRKKKEKQPLFFKFIVKIHFVIKHFEKKYISRPPFCIFLPPKFNNERQSYTCLNGKYVNIDIRPFRPKLECKYFFFIFAQTWLKFWWIFTGKRFTFSLRKMLFVIALSSKKLKTLWNIYKS